MSSQTKHAEGFRDTRRSPREDDWYTRKTLPVELAKYSLWPGLDTSQLPQPLQDRADRLCGAIKAYLDGRPVKIGKEIFRVDPKDTRRVMNRCVKIAPDGRLWGWRALVYEVRIEDYRREELPVNGSDIGFAGSFSCLLREYPEIKKKIIAEARKIPRELTVFERNKRVVDMHDDFLVWCHEAGIAAYQYPLFTADRGLRSLCAFMNMLIDENYASVAKDRFGKDAHHRATSVGGGEAPYRLAVVPYDVAQMDAHQLHCVGTVKVPTTSGWTHVPIRRVWIIVICDVVSEAILGYEVIFRRQPNSAHAQAAAMCALGVWKPRELIVRGMSYRPGAGLPSGVIPETAGAAWSILQVDNALMDFSKRICDGVAKRVGCALMWGGIERWEGRPAIENIFGRLEARGFSRLPSSTGTNNQDPTIDDPNKAAVESRLEMAELLDLIDVVICDYNAHHIGSMGKSPLAVLRDYVASQGTLCLLRKLPPAGGGQVELDVSVEECTVRGSRSRGERPYIRLDRERYTGPVLREAWNLIGRKIIVHVRDKDYRTVRAFYDDGRELDVLTVMGRWREVPHSREERKLVNSMVNGGELLIPPHVNPVTALRGHLSQKAREDAAKQRKKRPKTSQATSDLANLQFQTGDNIEVFPANQSPPKPPPGPKREFPLGRFADLVRGSTKRPEGSK